jgi:signal peptidase II
MRKTGLCYLWLTILIFTMDVVTKQLAEKYLIPYISVPIFPFFNLTLAYNTGAAFSLLDTGSIWPNLLFGIIASAVSLVIVIWLYRISYKEKLLGVALSSILGGALGNLCDRIRYQHVIDFMDFYVSNWHWPVFNIADVGVCLGALLVIYQWIKTKD